MTEQQGSLTEEQRDRLYFLSLVQNFQTLAWAGLGKIANPDGSDVKVDLDQARWAIDMLGMLRRRTEGNLGPEEERELKQVLHTLRMNYVEEAEAEKRRADEAAEAPPAEQAASAESAPDDAAAEAEPPPQEPADGAEEEE